MGGLFLNYASKTSMRNLVRIYMAVIKNLLGGEFLFYIIKFK